MVNLLINGTHFTKFKCASRGIMVRDAHIIKKGEIIPKTKKFGCVGRGDLTFLFKSCEIYESQGDLSSRVENN